MSKTENYAIVEWQAQDVKVLKPLWTLEESKEWLVDNEGRIQDRLTELGWEVLESLLMMEDDEEENDNEEI